jgi:hypothetical protein
MHQGADQRAGLGLALASWRQNKQPHYYRVMRPSIIRSKARTANAA